MMANPFLRSAVIFNPEPFELEFMPSLLNNRVPRYLFRVHHAQDILESPALFGISRASWTHKAYAEDDVFTMARRLSRLVLDSHLRGHCNDTCTLVSWSSSILYALHRAVLLFRSERSKAEDLYICMLDTRCFPRKTFVHNFDLLRVLRDGLAGGEDDLQALLVRRLQQLRPYGEYLSQGRLQVKDRIAWIKVRELFSTMLFENHFPELLTNDVCNGSDATWYALNQLMILEPGATRDHLLELRSMIDCAKIDFRGAIHLKPALAIHLYAIRRRALAPMELVKEMRKSFRGMSICASCERLLVLRWDDMLNHLLPRTDDLLYDLEYDTAILDSELVQELQQYKAIVDALRVHRYMASKPRSRPASRLLSLAKM